MINSKEYAKQYYLNNKKKLLQLNKQNYKSKREEKIKCAKEYYLKNKEHMDEYRKGYLKEYRQIKKIELRRYDNKYKRNHPEKRRHYERMRRAKKLAVNENYTIADEQYTKSLFNNVCVNCGSREGLTVDHHYPLNLGHALTRQNSVLLCSSCNSSKGDKLPEEFYTKDKLQEINNNLGRLITIP